MITRRLAMLGFAALMANPREALAHKTGEPFVLDSKYMPQIVAFPAKHPAGTVVIDPRNRFLYLVQGDGTALRYGVGVGKAGLAWSGTAEIARKAKWPSWTPTPNMIKRDPKKICEICRGRAGRSEQSSRGTGALFVPQRARHILPNPRHQRALDHRQSRLDGCIRMLNEHVSDLYERVSTGAKVVVLN